MTSFTPDAIFSSTKRNCWYVLLSRSAEVERVDEVSGVSCDENSSRLLDDHMR